MQHTNKILAVLFRGCCFIRFLYDCAIYGLATSIESLCFISTYSKLVNSVFVSSIYEIIAGNYTVASLKYTL